GDPGVPDRGWADQRGGSRGVEGSRSRTLSRERERRPFLSAVLRMLPTPRLLDYASASAGIAQATSGYSMSSSDVGAKRAHIGQSGSLWRWSSRKEASRAS